MGTAKADVDICPECQAPNPWVYENDEYNCRHCGHVRTGSLAAKFRDEGEYVAPLTEVYLKNPAYRDKQQGLKSGPASAFVQKSEADLYRQIFGCVRNTLNLPELVAHRAYSILELVRKKHSKVRITPGVKHLAMCAALVAAREAGHQVSDLQISTMIGKSIVHVQNDVRLICKTLERPYADYRGVNEYALKVIRVADDIARLFLDATDLSGDIANDTYFRNTQDFCAAYRPHLDIVYRISERVERLAEITGVWQNRTPDYCTIASVFIALQMAGKTYQHQTRLFTEQLRKHVFFTNVASWQPRTREIQRVTMDLAFYLPQIGKARVIPELVSPWRGRMARSLPFGQVFIFLLPDVLDNMDALWEKRELDLEREKDTNSKKDVEARLQEALSAFLPPIPDIAPSILDDYPSDKDGSTDTSPHETDWNGDSGMSEPVQSATSRSVTRIGSSERVSPIESSVSASPCRNSSTPPEQSQITRMPDSTRSTSLPADPACQHARSSITKNAAIRSEPEGLAMSRDASASASGNSTIPGKRKRDPSKAEDSGNKRLDMRKRENRVKDPVKEHELQTKMRERIEKRLTAKQVRDLSRQRNQREVGIGVKNPAYMKSGRLVYGRRRHGLYDTGHFVRLPSVLRLLQEWQTQQSGSEAGRDKNANLAVTNDGRSHAWLLRRDLRAGRHPSTIPEHRFPTSVAMAKAMLNDIDIDCPVIGPEDDMYFEDGELDGYLGDKPFQKARMELWDAQGLDKYIHQEAVYSEKAFEIASKRDSRVASLRAVKMAPAEKMNSARLAQVMESFREDSEEMMEIDPILRKEFGRSLFHAAVQVGGVDGYDGDDKDKDNDYGNKDDSGSEKEEYEEKEDEYGSNVPSLNTADDDAFEVVGDSYDFDVSRYLGYDGCSDGEEY